MRRRLVAALLAPIWMQLLPSIAVMAQQPGARRLDYGSLDVPAAFDSTLLAGLSWRQIGPDRGGRSLAVGGSSERPREYWFGATGGGVWKTTDGGTTWKPVTDGEISSASVGALAVAPSDPDVVYVGMGEAALRGSITQGDGVYRTTDGGETWTHLGLEDTQTLARIRVSPTDPDLVYVAALGHPYGPNPERGVFRSRDGGQTWNKVLFVSDSAGAVDLAMDPHDPSTLYAATWQVYRTPWKMWDGGPHSGLWKTTDGGDHWTELTGNPGMPDGPVGRIGVTVSGADPSRVWAIVEAPEGGLFRSDDAGATWKKVNSERKIRQRAFYFSDIFADPSDRSTIYAGNVSFFRSRDGGVTFKRVDTNHGDYHTLWIAPDDPDRMIVGDDGGGEVTVNGGETWTDLDFPTAQFYHVSVTGDRPYHVCGAQQDNSTACVPSEDWDNMHEPGAGTGSWMYAVGGGESGYVTPSLERRGVFYAGTQGAIITRYDRSNGQVRDIQPDPRFFSGEPASALRERWQWTFPIVIDPIDSTTLYIASQNIWRTRDEGQSWEKISPDLTYADPKTLGKTGGPITMDMNGPEIYATVFAIAPSHLEEGTIWAGSDDGRVHVTRDGGEHWTEVTPPDMEKFTRVSIIDASRHDPGTAYVAANRYQMDDRGSFLWKTHDYGKTWTRIGEDIRGPTRVIREDPVRPGLLYVGTEHGVWVSPDDGVDWQPLRPATPDTASSGGLPDTPVRDLVVKDADLVLGTHGRGFWIMDDIEPLRESGGGAGPVQLFEPADAVRRTLGSGSGAGAATIQYRLASAADSVTVQILDADGNVVRTYRGPKEEAKPDSTAESEYGDRGPPAPSAKAGLNRFAWDLRYPPATKFDGMVIWNGTTRGPLAPPGPYRVRLTADGQTRSAGFRVVADPRLEGVTAADLRAQFELASKIRDATDLAHRAVIQVRSLRRQLVERLASVTGEDSLLAADTTAGEGGRGESWVTRQEAEAAVAAAGDAAPELSSAARALIESQAGIEEALYQVQNRAVEDPLNFPIRLDNRLAALRRSLETGNARPTDAEVRVYGELRKELDGHIADLDATLSKELAAVNRALEARSLEPISSER
ncbi:MAG TPA: FlgD immunoglobulin-like domain containing protein [Gemmatimonadota bacterium]|nr:FlgD immunoglobulin-like domain containing protein [Gemmatimonadota bacterium]